MQIFYEPAASKDSFILNKTEAQHCLKALRKKRGDIITIVDGNGMFYECSITHDNIKNCELKVLSTQNELERSNFIHVAIAPTKNIDRTEWFVEKCVEIGIDEISFILCSNSERKQLNEERIIKKAVSAMKQSLKASIPKINPLTPYVDFIKHSPNEGGYIAFVDFSNPHGLWSVAQSNDHHLVLIGPEGDFTQAELELAQANNFENVSLGKSRLRTETAGIVACTILNQH